MNKKDLILVMVAVVVVLVAAFVLIKTYAPSSVTSFLDFNPFNGGKEAVAKKAIDFINGNLLENGQTAALVDAKNESGVVKFTIKIGETTYDSFVTTDGKLFCPQFYDLKSPLPSASPVQS